MIRDIYIYMSRQTCILTCITPGTVSGMDNRLPVPAHLDPAAIAAAQPLARALLLGRLEDMYHEAEDEAQAARLSERGGDPRWLEIKLRVAKEMKDLLLLNKPAPQVPEEDPDPGRVERDARMSVMAELERVEAATRG